MRSNDELNKPRHEFLGLNKSSEVREEKRRSSERQSYPSSSSITNAFRPFLLPGKAHQIFREALRMLKKCIFPLLPSFPPGFPQLIATSLFSPFVLFSL